MGRKKLIKKLIWDNDENQKTNASSGKNLPTNNNENLELDTLKLIDLLEEEYKKIDDMSNLEEDYEETSNHTEEETNKFREEWKKLDNAIVELKKEIKEKRKTIYASMSSNESIYKVSIASLQIALANFFLKYDFNALIVKSICVRRDGFYKKLLLRKNGEKQAKKENKYEFKLCGTSYEAEDAINLRDVLMYDHRVKYKYYSNFLIFKRLIEDYPDIYHAFFEAMRIEQRNKIDDYGNNTNFNIVKLEQNYDINNNTNFYTF